MRRVASGQLLRRAHAQVEVYGGASIYEFGNAFNDRSTPSGHTFACRPSKWPVPYGTASWFSCALPDGKVAMGSMCLTDNEVFKTMVQTSLFTFDPTTETLQAIPIPTDKGYIDPPNTNLANNTSGASVDDVISVNLGGIDYIFACIPLAYGGWRISTYGTLPTIAGFKKVNGEWAYDPTHSYTSNQLAVSNATAFPPVVNSFGETYYNSLGPVEMEVTPVSKHLLMARYFYRNGHRSGSIVAVDPATGTVTAWYEFPDVTSGSTPLNVSARGIAVDPTGVANDERFILTPDVFNTLDANSRFQPALMEFRYNAGAGTITLVSTPNAPTTPAGVTDWFNSYNLVEFDENGNLWLQSSGGPGLSVFHGNGMHLFQKVGTGWPTFENGGPAADWYTTQYPTYVNGDFQFGTTNVANGADQSINWDSTNNRLLLTTLAGKVYSITPSGTLALGPEILPNTDFSVDASGWNGFFTSTVSRVADAAFPSGFALEMTRVDDGNNLAASSAFTVTPYQNYRATVLLKSTTVARQFKITLWFNDASNTLVGASSSTEITSSTSATTYTDVYAAAPATAASGFVLIQVLDCLGGETHRISAASWKTEPGIGSAPVDTNKTNISASYSTQNNKGCIVGSRLYTSLQTKETASTKPVPYTPYPLPQHIIAVDLDAFG